MSLQIGTVDGLVNITKEKVNCFVEAIISFSNGGEEKSSSLRISLGSAFQRYVEPVYRGDKDDFDLDDIAIPVYTKGGNEQSPARITFCKKMGLLFINEEKRIFRPTPICEAIHNGDITIEDYAFILLSKQGVFANGIYIHNLFVFISKWFSNHSTISEDDLRIAISSNINDSNIEKTRLDITINAFTVCGLLSCVSRNIYVIADTIAAKIFDCFSVNESIIKPALLDTNIDYSNYIGSFHYGLFDVLCCKNAGCILEKFPNLKQYQTSSLIFSKEYENHMLQQIYYGAPGTGKSFTIDNLTNDDNSVRTTFHPDTDYASFVGAYKPTMKSVKMSAFVGKEVQFAQPQQGHPGTEQRIVYKYVPQAFLKAYVAAWSNLNTPYYLIIEEINRGNCAQIFGDLFQLLDRNNAGSSSYAINADEDITKFLKEDMNGFASLSQEQRDAIAAYELVKDNGEKRAIGGKILDGTLLLLPHNLHIWATMNTSDQSLFPIDSAFKRRWNWKYVPIDTNPLDKRTQQPLNWKFEVASNLYSWGKFLEKINPEIYSITESSDKQMGYFFAKADPATGIISEEVFLNKVLFYLWTDVFKDYDVSSEIFKNKKENRSFRFTDFFEDAAALANFIENCKLESEEIEPQNAEDEEKQSRRKPYTSLSVSFPDGTIVKEDTIFGTFRTAIEKIGIDKISDFAKSAPVMRKGLPIIDTQEQQVLLDANYTYEQVGNYFVLSQIKNVSYRKFLEDASKALNLNINITLE